MIKCELRSDFLPAGRCMALFALLLLELSMVRIGVARRARRKLHVLESCRTARRIWLVTGFALHLSMQASQRIARLGMVKFLRRLPVLHVVAALTILSELALVIVLMACNALGRLP